MAGRARAPSLATVLGREPIRPALAIFFDDEYRFAEYEYEYEEFRTVPQS